MAKKSDKMTWREAWKINIRAIKLLNSKNRMMFPYSVIHAISDAVGPYVGIYISARLITELTTLRRWNILLGWALAAVISTAVFFIFGSLMYHFHAAKSATFWQSMNRIEDEKYMSMDYCDVEDQKVRDLSDQIEQNRNWGGWGFNTIQWRFENMVNSLFSIIGAVALTIGLFIAKVPDSSGNLTILNHPLFVLLIAALMGFVVWVCPVIGEKAENLRAGLAENARLGNRLFGHFGYLKSDEHSQVDIRMYHQERISRYYAMKEGPWYTGGVFDRLYWGKMGFLNVLRSLFNSVLTAGIYVFVCLKAWAGAFGIGQVTQYIGALSRFSGAVRSFLDSLFGLRTNAKFLKTIFELLDIPNNMYQGSITTEKRSDRKYDVEFKNVSFRYPNTDKWVLKNVSVKFKIGTKLAVVGENGSGKSTFIKLLCRLYDPQEGEILLNGVDIRKYNYDDYIGVFSVVFQDFRLISQRLGENVAGSDEYDREKAVKCLEDAGFGERLRELPDGLDTWLYKGFDEDGILVSGGEEQKIAIARALFKNAPFIILDEPTAALDPIAEADIYQKFDEIVGDRTAVYISHRLSSCRFCQEILVFADGQIVQNGSHDLLVETDGLYKKLWYAQAQYYAEEEKNRQMEAERAAVGM